MGIFDLLDEQQLQAATAPDGMVKVVAGAGTGKTTTLKARVVYLIENGIPPEAIRAITFTRKAANEFQHRLTDEIGEDIARQVRLGTFHSYCARFLRAHYRLADLSDPRFMIADDDEVLSLIERAVEDSGVVQPVTPPDRPEDMTDAEYKSLIKIVEKAHVRAVKEIASEAQKAIGRWKESGLTTESVLDPARNRRSEQQEIFARIYVSYQDALERRNMVDFGDLILKTVGIFDRHPDLMAAESGRIRHLLVDEFQDCNLIQARLVRQLSSVHGNLMVVGDPDQSIYAFRAACPAVMEQMSGPGITEITLINNRRSTQPLLDAANLVVDHLPGRSSPKILRSALPEVEAGAFPIRVARFADDFKEAMDAASQIAALISSGAPPQEIAVLLRMSRMSVPFEEQLIRKRIPYRVWKGTSLLERAEMRDLLGYLKLAASPRLDLSFERIVNRPTRGLGDAALNSILGMAGTMGLTFSEACARFASNPVSFRVRQEAKDAAQALGVLLGDIAEMARNDAPPLMLLEHVIRETGYRQWLKDTHADNAYTRFGNVEILLDLAAEYDNVFDFLNDIYLFTDVDSDRAAGMVQIMTIHASKGLEFDHVFVPGLEDGTLPHKSAREDDLFRGSLDDPWTGPDLGGTNEERCLCHVAFTRARKTLHVSYAGKRGFGSREPLEPSPFLRECEIYSLTERPKPPVYRPRRQRTQEPDRSYSRPISFGPRR